MLNVRDQVTQRIIEALEAGTPPWRKGWDAMESHFNASTDKQYQGINQLLLGMSGFSDPRWLTLKQANAMKSDEHPDGLRVKKGEKATMIVRMVEVARGSKEAETGYDRKMAHHGRLPRMSVAASMKYSTFSEMLLIPGDAHVSFRLSK